MLQVFAEADGAPLVEHCEPLVVAADHTTPMAYNRYGRAGRFTPLRAIYGSVEVARPASDTLRALVVGEALHAGRWTAFGCGRYVIESGTAA